MTEKNICCVVWNWHLSKTGSSLWPYIFCCRQAQHCDFLLGFWEKEIRTIFETSTSPCVSVGFYPGLPPKGTHITASHLESLPLLQKGRKVSPRSKPLTNYRYLLPKWREFISGKDPGSFLGLFACQWLVISYILSKAALYAIHSCRFQWQSGLLPRGLFSWY